MKNGTDEILEAKIAERNERAKKLYRYVSELARRVGDMTASSQSIMDMFSMHIEIQRQKLRDNCEKLFFLDPQNYGKKTLELLWRKVYYDTVSTAKKLRESDTDNDNYIFSHIVCGIGHFHQLISKISSDMKMEYKELDYVTQYDEIDQHQEGINALTEEEIHLGKYLLHSCLIYLGDLSRYQSEIFHSFDSSIAARYYLQAAHIDMSLGMPYNQLGNLYLDKNYNLDSVCYYIHCLNCAVPFEGALDNLIKIFEKNEQFSEAIHDTETLNQTEHIQNSIVNFLSLIEIWYLGKNDTNIPQRCNAIAHSLKVSMDFEITQLPDYNKNYDNYVLALEEENTNPTYFNPNLIHKVVQICLFTIPKMAEVDETKAFACKAFTLAFLAQLLQKLQKQLQAMGLKNPANKYRERTTSVQDEVPQIENPNPKMDSEEELELPAQPDITNVVCISGDDDESGDESVSKEESEKITNGDSKNGKKAPHKRRRRRRALSSDSSDLSGVESENSDVETYESCSGDENESDSSYQSDSDDSDVKVIEEGTEKCNGDVKEKEKEPTVNGIPEKVALDKEETKQSNDVHELNETQLKSFLLGNNTLASIKLLQDWALSEKDLILSCGDSGESMFQCVVDLLNILSHYFIHESDMLSDADNESPVLRYARSIANKVKLEFKNTPLPEDVNLRGTNICKFDKDAAEWKILDKINLSVYEENVIRILNFIEFGNHLAKIVPKIRYNRTMKIFYLKKAAPKLNIKVTHKGKREWHNSKKPHDGGTEGGLLRKLGRLWLTSQVRELERSGRQPAGPALLALDTAVMHKHLRRVKQLLRARNYILLIPAVVLQELDNLKREQSSARDAIRWLEVQLKSGSRFLRAQRPGQARPLPLLKYPRKAPQHINNFIQILEFCNHFIGEDKQGGSGDSDKSLPTKSTPLLVLLTGEHLGNEDEQYKEFSVTGAAKSAGISVQYIEDFYAKWRNTVLKSGKKR